MAVVMSILRAHFKTPVEVSEADKRGAEMKEINGEYRPLYSRTASVTPGFEMRSKSIFRVPFNVYSALGQPSIDAVKAIGH